MWLICIEGSGTTFYFIFHYNVITFSDLSPSIYDIMEKFNFDLKHFKHFLNNEEWGYLEDVQGS